MNAPGDDVNDMNAEDAVAAHTPDVWGDMRFLTALTAELARPAMTDRDGYPTYQEMGFKPGPPPDPRWLWAVTVALVLVAAASIPLIIYSS